MTRKTLDQLTIDLPELDEKATRDAVKRLFKKYHDHKDTIKTITAVSYSVLRDVSGHPGMSLTAMYPRDDADAIRGSSKRRTAEQDMTIVVERLQQIAERDHERLCQIEQMQQFVDAIEKVVSNLPPYEKEIIENTLMLHKHARQNDSVIWPRLGLCKSDYYPYKNKAINRIAYALQVAIFKKKDEM